MHPPTRQLPDRGTPTGYQAVQEDTAVTCVDWQPSHAWTDRDVDFTGQVSILGPKPGKPVAAARWDTPTDHAADHALHQLGWHRTGPWNTDPLGRRTAPVTDLATLPAPPNPGRDYPSH